MTRGYATSLTLGVMLAQPALGDQVFNEDIIALENICIGATCENGETFGSVDLKIKSLNPVIMLEDTTQGQNDWQIGGDLFAAGLSNHFGVTNVSQDFTPVLVNFLAGDHSLYIGLENQIGMGTVLPQSELHLISNGTETAMRLETGMGVSAIWDIEANALGYRLRDINANTSPFRIFNGAPENAVTIHNSGNFGLGTMFPSAPLEVFSTDSFNFFRITATGAANESVDITYTGGPLGTGQLRYNIVDGDNQEMSLDADGNMVLDGTLTTAGPTCAGGCDRVFDPDYALPSISAHAEQMFAAGHLPQIGATLPHAPVNLSERQGGIINSLEHAHIYVGQLHARLEEQERLNADLLTRLTAQEAQLAELRAALLPKDGIWQKSE